MKKILFLTTLCVIFATSSFASAISNNSRSTNSISTTSDLTKSTLGVGFSVGTRVNLSTNIFADIFSDEFDEEEKTKEKNADNIFTELEIFANHNISGDINYNYGARFNIGYEMEGMRIYPSLGYINAGFDYIEDDSSKQSLNESAPFVGFGIGYDINNSLGLRLNYAIYSIDFQPEGSSYDNVEVDVSTLNLNLAFHF